MALYPVGYTYPMRLFDQHFGSGLLDDDILAPLSMLGTARPRHFRNREASGLSAIKCDKNSFQVNLDVQQFKPEELHVKTVDNEFVVIEGKHEEKEDEHGSIYRHFVRRYRLPKNSKADAIQCHLSSDGVLQIQIAREVKELGENERHVPIAHSGEPAIALTQRKTEALGSGDVKVQTQ